MATSLAFFFVFQVLLHVLLLVAIGDVHAGAPPSPTGKPHQHPLPSGALSALNEVGIVLRRELIIVAHEGLRLEELLLSSGIGQSAR